MSHAKSRGAEGSDTVSPAVCVAAALWLTRGGPEGAGVLRAVLRLRSVSVPHHHRPPLQGRRFSSDQGSRDSEPETLFHQRGEKAEEARGFM